MAKPLLIEVASDVAHQLIDLAQTIREAVK